MMTVIVMQKFHWTESVSAHTVPITHNSKLKFAAAEDREYQAARQDTPDCAECMDVSEQEKIRYVKFGPINKGFS